MSSSEEESDQEVEDEEFNQAFGEHTGISKLFQSSLIVYVLVVPPMNSILWQLVYLSQNKLANFISISQRSRQLITNV